MSKILSAMGYHSAGAFSSLSDRDLKELFDEITVKITGIAEQANHTLKKSVEEDLEKMSLTLHSFALPSGHKQIIRSIRKHFSTLPRNDSGSNSSTNLLHKIRDLVKKRLAKIRTDDLQESDSDIEIIPENNSWFISCPFCDSKIAAQVDGTSCKITNFERHVKDRHAKKNAEKRQHESDVELLSDSTLETCDTPLPKRVAISTPSSPGPSAQPITSPLPIKKKLKIISTPLRKSQRKSSKTVSK